MQWTAPSEKNSGNAVLAVCLRDAGPIPLASDPKSLKTEKTVRRCHLNRALRATLSKN